MIYCLCLLGVNLMKKRSLLSLALLTSSVLLSGCIPYEKWDDMSNEEFMSLQEQEVSLYKKCNYFSYYATNVTFRKYDTKEYDFNIIDEDKNPKWICAEASDTIYHHTITPSVVLELQKSEYKEDEYNLSFKKSPKNGRYKIIFTKADSFLEKKSYEYVVENNFLLVSKTYFTKPTFIIKTISRTEYTWSN